ncbi:MAG: APC family permease [Gemmatimonadetes bacterium]|nr:APC family permease [Gemmatimonadota bacterium]
MTPTGSGVAVTGPPTLRRVLRLRHLVLYGIVVIQPVAPMSVYGVLSERSQGHVVTTILIAMVAMLLTALSYGRMAAVYPSAGSAFTYVGQEIHPAAGYVTGWSMVMDYMINPMICIVWCSKAATDLFPAVPFGVFALAFFLLFTGLNLRGIEVSARFNTFLAAGMGIVILAFLAAAIQYVLTQVDGGGGASTYTRPFYDPSRWNSSAVLTGTSIAVLTYIGFDGISTLSEEVENPRRNILLATVFTCLAIGILSAVEVYAAQLIWPPAEPFLKVETAFAHAAMRAGGYGLFIAIMVTLTVANTGSGTGAQLGAARLLYGMGRSGALPRSFFASLHPKTRVPRNNVLFVGVVALLGAFVLELTGGYDLGAQLLNFGALIAFMGVNLSALVHALPRQSQRKLGYLLPPLFGFLICLLLWLNLTRTAKIAGAVWLLIGIAFGAWKTRGFRGNLVNFDLPSEGKP